MAMLQIAKNTEDKAEKPEDCIYESNKDLRNLLFYCNNHSTSCVMDNLYPLGMDCIYDKFLYLQKRRVKQVYTKALHFIIGFDTQNYEADIDSNMITTIMGSLSLLCFKEYQRILFLHVNKPSHYHVHYIINPINIYNLHICRWSFWTVAYSFAEILGGFYNIPLVPVSYQDEQGRIVKGAESGCYVYQQKFIRRYNLKEE